MIRQTRRGDVALDKHAASSSSSSSSSSSLMAGQRQARGALALVALVSLCSYQNSGFNVWSFTSPQQQQQQHLQVEQQDVHEQQRHFLHDKVVGLAEGILQLVEILLPPPPAAAAAAVAESSSNSSNHDNPTKEPVPANKSLRVTGRKDAAAASLPLAAAAAISTSEHVDQVSNSNSDSDSDSSNDSVVPKNESLLKQQPVLVPVAVTDTESQSPPTTQPFVIHMMHETDDYEARFPLVARQATPHLPFVAETKYHNTSRPLSELIFPVGGIPDKTKKKNTINNINNTVWGDTSDWIWPNASQAGCVLRPFSFYDEVPHNFQQLLRCFSWWFLEPNKDKEKVLYIVKYGHADGSTQGMEFIHDMYQAMQHVFGVRLEIGKRNHPDNTVVMANAPWSDMPHESNAYMVQSPEHAKTLRKGMLDYYTRDNPQRAGCPGADSQKNKPVIAFVDRQDSRRKISNVKDILDRLQKAGYDNVVYLPSFGNMTMVDQIKFMSQVDIVMGPHGAQFTTTLFQPDCGSLLEFFPSNYYTPGWFGSLAALSGKHHSFTYNGGDLALANARRTSSYAVVPEAVEQLTHVMVEKWHTCCAAASNEPRPMLL